MKNNRVGQIIFVLAFILLAFSACKKEEDVRKYSAATITGIRLTQMPATNDSAQAWDADISFTTPDVNPDLFMGYYDMADTTVWLLYNRDEHLLNVEQTALPLTFTLPTQLVLTDLNKKYGFAFFDFDPLPNPADENQSDDALSRNPCVLDLSVYKNDNYPATISVTDGSGKVVMEFDVVWSN